AVEAPALRLRIEERSLAGPGPAGQELHDARQRVGAVEAARGSPHDLHLLQLQRQQRAEVERAPRLVHGHAVDHDASRVRGAAARSPAGPATINGSWGTGVPSAVRTKPARIPVSLAPANAAPSRKTKLNRKRP